MIYDIATAIGYSIGAGLCLVVFSVFLSLSIMIIKSGWTADGGKPDTEYGPPGKEK